MRILAEDVKIIPLGEKDGAELLTQEQVGIDSPNCGRGSGQENLAVRKKFTKGKLPELDGFSPALT